MASASKKSGKSASQRPSPPRGKGRGGGRSARINAPATAAFALLGVAAGCAVLWLGFYALRDIRHLEGLFRASYASLYICMVVSALVTAMPLRGRTGRGSGRSGGRFLAPLRLLLAACALALLLIWHLYLDKTPYGFLYRMGQHALLLKAAGAICGAVALYALAVWAVLRLPRRL